MRDAEAGSASGRRNALQSQASAAVCLSPKDNITHGFRLTGWCGL